MSDNYVFTHDAAVDAYGDTESSGITVDDDGSASFDWSEIPVVELDEPAHKSAFDTDEFYKLGGVTAARPIKQPYRVGDSIEYYKKPADELRDAAWSLDNKPYPLTHPDDGKVKSVDEIHGFAKNPRYNDDSDSLKFDLYVPTNDELAREFISKYQDVSIGFYNRVHENYDGDTGDLTDDDVDGFQTDLYIDHIAGVKRGRCSGEDGCGIDHDSTSHGEIVRETADTDVESVTEGDGAQETCSPCTGTMSDGDKFNIQVDTDDLTIDSLEEQFDAVKRVREERDNAVESLEEVREDLDGHGFDVDDDECPCEVVDDVLHDHDEATDTLDSISDTLDVEADSLDSEVEQMMDELESYREDEKSDRLDDLEELNADRSEWEDESLDAIEEEIERREEVMDGLNVDTKGVDTTTDTDDENTEETVGGKRTFGRGHASDK